MSTRLKQALYNRKLKQMRQTYENQLKEGWDIVLPPPIDAKLPSMFEMAAGNWAYDYCQIPFVEEALKRGLSFQREVYICVADTGALSKNVYLKARLREDLALDHTGSNQLYDEHGHFSHCSGIFLAEKAGIPLGLLNHPLIPKDKFTGFGRKVLTKQGSGSYSWIEQFGEQLVKDIKAGKIPADAAIILSMSFGGGGSHTGVAQVMKELRSLGVFLHASAGNSSGPVGFPANLRDVAAISAHAQDEKPASFTNFGPEVYASGAGVGIMSTGDGPEELLTWSGTSMAGPVYGANIALLLSMMPDIRNMDDLEAFLENGNLKDAGEPGRDQYFGWGIARADYLIDESPTPPPPPPPPPPPAPEEGYKTARFTQLRFSGNHSIWWRVMGADANATAGSPLTMLLDGSTTEIIRPATDSRVVLRDISLVIETKSFALKAYEAHSELTDKFFANGKRGIIMPAPADGQDAAEWALFFLKLLANKEGGEIESCSATVVLEGNKTTFVHNRV